MLEELGSDLDVILLDQWLQRRGGLDLITHARTFAPFAKTIIVATYATTETIEHAFAQGVYDYVVKAGAFAAFIRTRVRNAAEATRARRLDARLHGGIDLV
jgi:response regulator of citrate/malate metabolism